MSVDEVIAEYRLLQTPPDALRSVVELAAFITEVPMATINIITADAQHSIATVGFDPMICRREDSMCAITVTTGVSIAIEDASVDDRYRSNPFVNGELGHVRFYANQPLVIAGERIGTLCVFDTVPHEVDDHRRNLLAVLADRVVDILELERQTRYLQTTLERTEELRDELRRSNDQLSAFAGQISHDLASALTSVVMSLELVHEELEGRPDVPPTIEDWVETGLRGTSRMEAMIRDILAYARLGGELRRTLIDLAEVVQAARFDVGVFDGDPRITVGPLPVVSADPTQLRAVFQNLLSNGLKFGGDEPRVQVSAVREGDAWLIEVADRGSGIDPDDVYRVFEPLVRVRTDVEGNGIGLSTCRRIVQAHGGTIGIRPRDGGGTVAWFRLPAALD
jgi:signal transduction histidine kinase